MTGERDSAHHKDGPAARISAIARSEARRLLVRIRLWRMITVKSSPLHPLESRLARKSDSIFGQVAMKILQLRLSAASRIGLVPIVLTGVSLADQNVIQGDDDVRSTVRSFLTEWNARAIDKLSSLLSPTVELSTSRGAYRRARCCSQRATHCRPGGKHS